jgi:pimeloyl-ACP methyl ester carboxylesterase
MRIILGLVVVLGLVAWFARDRIEALLVYPFDPAEITPQEAYLPEVTARELEVRGAQLVVWTAQAAPGKPTIFYLHGNAGGLKDRAARFRIFLDRGYGLIAPAYRGSSGSSGQPTEDALLGDAEALWQMGLAGSAPVVLYGESLGTGVATALMATPATAGGQAGGQPPVAVILEAPYTSLPDVAAHSWPKMATHSQKMANHWDSLARAVYLDVPLLILHGTEDELIPIAQGRALYQAATSREKRFLEVKGAGHTDLWRADTLRAMWTFIDGQPSTPPARRPTIRP